MQFPFKPANLQTLLENASKSNEKLTKLLEEARNIGHGDTNPTKVSSEH